MSWAKSDTRASNSCSDNFTLNKFVMKFLNFISNISKALPILESDFNCQYSASLFM